MPINAGQISVFPSQTVSDQEKASPEYGKEVAKAIEGEWFRQDLGIGRYNQNRDYFHKLRLYARGEQSTAKYRDDISKNGDLSYLNLDLTPVPIVPKFVDIVVNGMSDRLYDVKCVSTDEIATNKRTRFVERIERDMRTQDLLGKIEGELQINARNVQDPKKLPASKEELDLYMQIGYKQAIEIAQEEAITNIFMKNKKDEIQKRIYYDLVVLGMSCVKHTFNHSDGICLEYVDPADLIYSYTEEPDFKDCYYFGEVKRLRINEVKKLFPHLQNEELNDILSKAGGGNTYANNQYEVEDSDDSNTIELLFFNWKTFESEVYKIKETGFGLSKAIEKDDQFNPPEEMSVQYERVAQSRECIYEGVSIIGTGEIIKWEKAKNQVRPFSNINSVMMNYICSAPRMYHGRLESVVSRLIPFADSFQLDWLKLQQIRQREVPDGVYINADGLAEIDLGNGTTYTPAEALNMYYSTGTIVGRSMTMDGDPNAGAIPIQELNSSGSGQKIQTRIQSMGYILQLMRDVTGINEARDGSDPDPYSLVGVQKLAAANSNTATRHILESGLFIATEMANAVSMRFKDVLEFHPTRELFLSALGKFTAGTLKELKHLHLHDFGIYITLHPDDEEKQMLDNFLNQALSRNDINMEDIIDIKEINNLKLAKQMLKFRRRKKQEQDREAELQNIEAQSQANAQAAQAKAEAESQAEQVKSQAKAQIVQLQSQMDVQKLQTEAATKKELMQFEHELSLKIMEKQAELDRRMASMDAKKQGPGADGTVDKPEQAFESAGNDVLGGFDLGSYEPS